MSHIENIHAMQAFLRPRPFEVSIETSNVQPDGTVFVREPGYVFSRQIDPQDAPAGSSSLTMYPGGSRAQSQFFGGQVGYFVPPPDNPNQ